MLRNKVTVLIVDDDPKVLRSLQRLLELNGYFVQTFNSSDALLSYTLPDSPCCAVVDVQMPGLSGFELQSKLVKKWPGLPVIFITGFGDIPKAVAAIRGGAADFLTKPVEEKKLLETIKRALAQEERHRVEHEELASYRSRFESLTAREKQVCALVVEGKLNKQIAAELGAAEKTIKVHRGRVMKKMKVQSLAELVRVVMKVADPAAAHTEEKGPQPSTPQADSKRAGPSSAASRL